jgi:hypothetical protein
LILDKEIIKACINLEILDLKKVGNKEIMEKINKAQTAVRIVNGTLWKSEVGRRVKPRCLEVTSKMFHNLLYEVQLLITGHKSHKMRRHLFTSMKI